MAETGIESMAKTGIELMRFLFKGMVSVIKEFCKVKNIDVNMRVGIHTGYVLCGVVGTRRFKVDF